MTTHPAWLQLTASPRVAQIFGQLTPWFGAAHHNHEVRALLVNFSHTVLQGLQFQWFISHYFPFPFCHSHKTGKCLSKINQIWYQVVKYFWNVPGNCECQNKKKIWLDWRKEQKERIREEEDLKVLGTEKIYLIFRLTIHRSKNTEYLKPKKARIILNIAWKPSMEIEWGKMKPYPLNTQMIL